MSATIGPTTWWLKSKEAADYYARICPVGTVLGDGSAVYRRDGGLAWIVSPISTQSGQQWANGTYNVVCATSLGKQICCICEWSTCAGSIYCCLIANGFNPCDWFIPDQSILFTAYQCAAAGYWGGVAACSSAGYWSYSEFNASCACNVNFNNGGQSYGCKSDTSCVRSVRCVCL